MTATLDQAAAAREQTIAELQRQLGERTAERDAALAREGAITEVLQVINSSPGDLAQVFDAMLEKALSLCEAALGTLVRFDGVGFHWVAARGVPEAYLADPAMVVGGQPPSPGTSFYRLIHGEDLVHIEDITADEVYRSGNPGRQRFADLAGARTAVWVALRKDGALLGALVIYRQEIRPFSDKQIALLQNFAAQAVIAMENARLLTETREALDQQTATAEVLQVINASPGDLGPVFDVMLEKSLPLCEAAFGIMTTYDGEQFHTAAIRGVPPALAEALREPRRPTDRPMLQRLVHGESIVHVADVTEARFKFWQPLFDLGGARTMIWVALRKDGQLLGTLAAYRQEVRPFTDKQIALLQNFAAQAVIAMENARLITETREALEQQTATAEVLQVINASPGDLAPVFDAILEKAHSLCGAPCGSLQIYDGEQRFHAVATRGLPEPFAAILRRGFRLDANDPELSPDRVFQIGDETEVVGHLAPDHPSRAAVELAGIRTVLFVPLTRDNVFLGRIVAARQEVRPFSEKQIALLQNFAAQAVIAMENARLITETQEALEQQTATAEVLQVINSSPRDLAPVFQVILEKAHALCGVESGGLVLFDGDHFRLVANHAMPERHAQNVRRPYRATPGSAQDRLLRGERFVHIEDVRANPTSPQNLSSIEAGTRTLLLVPLRKDGALLGFITSIRREVRPFSEKEIALLENFAVQAVIAIENARLLRETRESLERQTATSHILRAIAAAPSEAEGTLREIAETTSRLFGASGVTIRIAEGDEYASAIHVGRGAEDLSAAFGSRMAANERVLPRSLPGTVLRENRQIHLPDLDRLDPEMADWPGTKILRAGGARTLVGTPLRREGRAIGSLHVWRDELRPFNDAELQLLQSFADQAAIAIENARLINETREALEQQTATAEVLQVINSSPGDLRPVFDVVLEKAARLCETAFGLMMTWDGERFHRVAFRGVPDGLMEVNREPMKPLPGTFADRLVRGESIIFNADLREAEASLVGPGAQALIHFGARAHAIVALRKDDKLLGAIAVYRTEVRPFTEKQIALLQNFAAQAVIAMENARLLGELRQRTGDLEESLEYQTATSDVLKVISRSTFELQPVLDALLQAASRLCGDAEGALALRDGDVFRCAAAVGVTQEFEAALRERTYGPDRGSTAGRVALEGRVVHIADVTADPEYALKETAAVGGIRTTLGVPLLRQDETIGIIVLFHRCVEPFTERQIELVRTFADQAVIAIENTRLLTETREALERQQAIAEVLQVINSSPGDLQPVFDILLDKAMQLCGASFGAMRIIDGDQLRMVATRGVPAAYAEFRRDNPQPMTGPGVFARLRGGEPFVHVVDMKDDDLYRNDDPQRRAMVDLAGARTSLTVALRRDRDLPGGIQIYRQEVRPFSDQHIALLQAFAAQAVIAMDNARLLDEIRQRQAELRVTFDNMGDGVAMFDADLRLAAWNRNFQDMLDLPNEFLAERPSFAAYFRHLADRGEFGSADLEAELARGIEDSARETRFERTRPDGRVIEVRRNAVPGGGSVLIYSDITERKRAEEAIRAARDTAEGALRELKTAQANLIQAEKMASLGQLTAGIAHEIKNPLNFVNNFANLSVELLVELKETTAPAVAALGEDKRAEVNETIEMLTGNLDKIAEHGRRADNIVKSMLEHSRGVTGERREVNLNGLIEEALNLAYHGARAQDQGFNITLECEFDQALPPVELAPQEITRVFLNLFGNGFYAANKRARENGDGSFRPVLHVATQDVGNAVEVRVRDNGAGIPPEIKDKLFQPFFTTKPTGEGTGLGLSISYDIVTQQHGGTITVDSELGSFTEFTVRLPHQ